MKLYGCSVVQNVKKTILSVLIYCDLRVCAQISPYGRGERGWCMPTTHQAPTSDTELGASAYAPNTERDFGFCSLSRTFSHPVLYVVC